MQPKHSPRQSMPYFNIFENNSNIKTYFNLRYCFAKFNCCSFCLQTNDKSQSKTKQSDFFKKKRKNRIFIDIRWSIFRSSFGNNTSNNLICFRLSIEREKEFNSTPTHFSSFSCSLKQCIDKCLTIFVEFQYFFCTGNDISKINIYMYLTNTK